MARFVVGDVVIVPFPCKSIFETHELEFDSDSCVIFYKSNYFIYLHLCNMKFHKSSLQELLDKNLIFVFFQDRLSFQMQSLEATIPALS